VTGIARQVLAETVKTAVHLGSHVRASWIRVVHIHPCAHCVLIQWRAENEAMNQMPEVTG
jgi:hypothetical protein